MEGHLLVAFMIGVKAKYGFDGALPDRLEEENRALREGIVRALSLDSKAIEGSTDGPVKALIRAVRRAQRNASFFEARETVLEEIVSDLDHKLAMTGAAVHALACEFAPELAWDPEGKPEEAPGLLAKILEGVGEAMRKKKSADS